MKTTLRLLLCALLMATFGAARAELVEEIVAWVNGEIITKSEYDAEEQSLVAEVYRQFSGEELDQRLAQAREQLLAQMIDRKILVQHAQAIGYDIDSMGDVFFDSFKDQQMQVQRLESDEEFDELLLREGMTVDEVKKTLIEMYAPEEVIRFEVRSRLSVGDSEIQAYYDENPQQFEVAAEATLREIVLLAEDDDAKERRRTEAESLHERLVNGEDFASLAIEHSEAGTQEAGGVLGPIEVDDLSDLLAEAALNTPVGNLANVLEAPYGFHIVRVDARADRHLKPIDDVREQVRVYLENRKYQKKLDEFLIKARENSEWCVKPKYEAQLSIPAPEQCRSL